MVAIMGARLGPPIAIPCFNLLHSRSNRGQTMGTVLGERFEILKEIGKGSRGVVYLASDRVKGGSVALKVFPSLLESGSFEEFRNEFSILSHIQDPSLAALYDFGFDLEAKSFFLAEEYFEGEPLSRLSGRLAFPKMVEITAQLCRVLQVLHNQGIFHGDLKPSNILVRGNEIKLVDFGLAGHFGSPPSQQLSTISGTLAYMAPELFLGAPVDNRSDLYSLGTTLYELICGHPPFKATTVSDLVEQHLFQTPINPVSNGSDYPREFGFIIMRLLNKDPSDRFEEANDVISALNLQFHFDFPLGPKKPLLSTTQEKEPRVQQTPRLYERAARYYEGKKDLESRLRLAEIYYRQGNWEKAEQLLQGLGDRHAALLKSQIVLKKGQFENQDPPERATLLKRILEINRRISLPTDLDKILEVIMDSMIEFTGAERGHLILREGGENRVRVTRNMQGEEIENPEQSFSCSLVERVLKTGKPVITLDAMNDDRFSMSLSIHKLKLRSIVCIPFCIRDSVIGAIYLDNHLQKGAFTEWVVELLQAFADQAAIAIANVTAFDELKKGTIDLKKTHEELRRSKEEIEELNKKLQASLSEKENELVQVRQSLATKQAALELKYRYDEIVGRSPKMMEVLKLLDRVTESDIAVFLFGESGVGKELIARAIHFNGPRKNGPFIPVNCSAIPENLLEAELFGYLRGAFTGADRDRPGLFEAANKGTLFLDEIGDMPATMQVKLLRVLEEGAVRRVGSQEMTPIDIRIVTASNRDIKELVGEKKFREDLFFRIHAVRIFIPPLRERKEDFPALIDYFLEKFSRDHKLKKKKILSRRAFDLLAGYSWPGNVRELENSIYNACMLADGWRIEPYDLKQKEELFSGAGEGEGVLQGESSFRESVLGFQKRLIRKVLEESQWNISQAAKKLKIARPQLSRIVKKLSLRPSPDDTVVTQKP